MGDCPGRSKETATRRNVTQGWYFFFDSRPRMFFDPKTFLYHQHSVLFSHFMRDYSFHVRHYGCTTFF